MITFRDQNTSVTPSGIRLLSWAHPLAEQTSYVNDIRQASRRWLHHASAGCHYLIASGRGPTELWEITKVTMCIFTSEWPQVGTVRCSKQAKRCNDSLQTLKTDFCMNYLIETKESFFCTYFCNKPNCPINWVNDPSITGNHHQQEKHAKIKTKNGKNTEDTLCSNRPLGTFFPFNFFCFLEADLKERVETRIKTQKSLGGRCFIWQLTR